MKAVRRCFNIMGVTCAFAHLRPFANLSQLLIRACALNVRSVCPGVHVEVGPLHKVR